MNSRTRIPGLDEYAFSSFDWVASRQWDYIVIGAGCTGTVTAHKILEHRPDARVLLLEQDPYLLPDHVQNLHSVYQPLMSAATTSPWRSGGDLEIVPGVPYLGGRTLFWSGSCPQPTLAQLREWPNEVVSELAAEALDPVTAAGTPHAVRH